MLVLLFSTRLKFIFLPLNAISCGFLASMLLENIFKFLNFGSALFFSSFCCFVKLSNFDNLHNTLLAFKIRHH